jgi:hypothetical protein
MQRREPEDVLTLRERVLPAFLKQIPAVPRTRATSR